MIEKIESTMEKIYDEIKKKEINFGTEISHNDMSYYLPIVWGCGVPSLTKPEDVYYIPKEVRYGVCEDKLSDRAVSFLKAMITDAIHRGVGEKPFIRTGLVSDKHCKSKDESASSIASRVFSVIYHGLCGAGDSPYLIIREKFPAFFMGKSFQGTEMFQEFRVTVTKDKATVYSYWEDEHKDPADNDFNARLNEQNKLLENDDFRCSLRRYVERMAYFFSGEWTFDFLVCDTKDGLRPFFVDAALLKDSHRPKQALLEFPVERFHAHQEDDIIRLLKARTKNCEDAASYLDEFQTQALDGMKCAEYRENCRQWNTIRY